ncbi:hypothetical protein HY045_02140 [Candidatus Woesebacteria bacterium]|nr:hypothetical protein [Candidatus Woesebacteria bacterium]
MDGSLFGTSGIRGDAESYFNDQFCFDLGRTFAIFLKNKFDQGGVAIGSDPRESSPRIKSSFSSGVIFEGLKIVDQGIAPIPSMNYILIVSNDNFAGSVMISGSHIKASLNGLKFFAGKEEILKTDEAQIDEIYNSIKKLVKFRNLSGQIVYDPTAVQFYLDYLEKKAKVPYKKWKAVVDPGSGAQSGVISNLLTKLGLDVVPVNDSNSKGFLARDTEVESDFESLKEEVKKNAADFGVGYDSDGDRAVFVDEKGAYITGDYTGTLVARMMPGKKIVTPINTSAVIESIGKEVIRTKVGSPYVVF